MGHLCVACIPGGDVIKACVLDADKVKGVVDLSLKPGLTHLSAAAAAAAGGSSSKKSKKQQQEQQALPAVGSEIKAVVLEIKEHYIVVALQHQEQQQQQQQQQQEQGTPQEPPTTQQNGVAHKKSSKKSAKPAAAVEDDAAAGQEQQQQQQQLYLALGFVARGDFNCQGSSGKDQRRFKHDQVVSVRVVAHPSAANGMRLLLEVCDDGHRSYPHSWPLCSLVDCVLTG
jgi:hypothetical protein